MWSIEFDVRKVQRRWVGGPPTMGESGVDSGDGTDVSGLERIRQSRLAVFVEQWSSSTESLGLLPMVRFT